MRAMKKDGNSGLRIGGRNFRPDDAGVRAAMNAITIAINESRRIHRADHGNAIAICAEVNR